MSQNCLLLFLFPLETAFLTLETVFLTSAGDWVLLDVRRPDQHEGARPEGCVSVPMYRLIDMSKPDFAKVIGRSNLEQLPAATVLHRFN